jgi:hypothetical protein
MVDTKMSSIAKKTAWISAFIVAQVFMFGHGFNLGKKSQLTMEKAMEIAKAQFTCRMEQK